MLSHEHTNLLLCDTIDFMSSYDNNNDNDNDTNTNDNHTITSTITTRFALLRPSVTQLAKWSVAPRCLRQPLISFTFNDFNAAAQWSNRGRIDVRINKRVQQSLNRVALVPLPL